jgi:hypothetical protein
VWQSTSPGVTQRHPAAVEGDAVVRIPAGRKLRHRSRKGDPPVLGRDGTALDDPEPGPAGCERPKTRIEPDSIEPHGVLKLSERRANRLYIGSAQCERRMPLAVNSFSITLCYRPAGRAACGSASRTALSSRSRKAQCAKAPNVSPASPFRVFPISIAMRSSAAWLGSPSAVVPELTASGAGAR